MLNICNAITSTAYRIPNYANDAWHIANLLSPMECDTNRLECLARSSGGRMLRSETPSKREYAINTEFSLYIAYRTLPLVEHLLQQPCRVSHTFESLYDAGDVLVPHVDREPLEWTLSIMLGDDMSSAGECELLSLGDQSMPVSIRGSSGDAVLFPGRKIPHWRQTPCPRRLITLLVHYLESAVDL